MKYILLLLLMLVFTAHQPQDLVYGNAFTKARGEKILAWTVSIDNTHRCNNNFTMYNYADKDYRVDYKLYLDDKVVYVGWIVIGAGEGMYWDDASIMCNPQIKEFTVDAKLEEVVKNNE